MHQITTISLHNQPPIQHRHRSAHLLSTTPPSCPISLSQQWHLLPRSYPTGNDCLLVFFVCLAQMMATVAFNTTTPAFASCLVGPFHLRRNTSVPYRSKRSLSNTFKDPNKRPRPFTSIVAVKTPPPASPTSPTSPTSAQSTLQRALQAVHQFNGTPEQGRVLAVQLVNSVTAYVAQQSKSSSSDEKSPSITTLYKQLSGRNLIRAFSTARAPRALSSSEKASSVKRLLEQAGLPLSALSPRRSTLLLWQFAGVAVVIAVVQLMQALGIGEYSRSVVVGLAVLLAGDQLLLRGMLFENVYTGVFPQYKEKVLTHEAGHFLTAYLHGMGVGGYVLNGYEALQAGIPGQAGTLFSDDELYEELNNGRLSSVAIDRFSIVVMGGIAAEAVYYGEAEGGESDISDLLTLLTGLKPAWTERNVKRQARWAVLEAIMVIRTQKKAFEALRQSMRERKGLGECMLCIEDNFVTLDESVESKENRESLDKDLLELREREMLRELERIGKQLERVHRKIEDEKEL